MIQTQEIIERSIYQALLDICVKEGYALDPSKYQPSSPENEAKYLQDSRTLKQPSIQIFGTGSPEAKDEKIAPRIVVEAMGFYPGNIGLPSLHYIREGPRYIPTEVPTETIDQYINIRLVAISQLDLRLLHNLMYKALPQRGYIKPYTSETLLSTGNIYMELVNFFDQTSAVNGILEKVYQFMITDCLIELPSDKEEITPIQEIEVTLDNGNGIEKIKV